MDYREINMGKVLVYSFCSIIMVAVIWHEFFAPICVNYSTHVEHKEGYTYYTQMYSGSPARYFGSYPHHVPAKDIEVKTCNKWIKR